MSLPRHCRAAFALLMSVLGAAGCHDARNALGDAGIAPGTAPTIASSAMRPTAAAPPLRARDAEALVLPADFPIDVFVPAGYSVNSVMDSGPMQVVSLRSRGRVSALFADAKGAMRTHGWTQTLAMQTAADNAMLSFEKDGRAAVLSFDQSGSDHDVTTSVQLRRAQ